MSDHTPEREYDEQADSAGSFRDAIAELRRRHLAGQAVPETGYFARRVADEGGER